MTLLDGFSFVALDKLPAKPGVVLVCCPEAGSDRPLRVTTVGETDNIRQLADENVAYWRRQCNGYLQYQVRVIHEEFERRALAQKIREHYVMTG